MRNALTICDEDGHGLGDGGADILVEHRVIIELNAVRNIADEHEAQILGDRRSANAEPGFLINVGGTRFEINKFVSTVYSFSLLVVFVLCVCCDS